MRVYADFPEEKKQDVMSGLERLKTDREKIGTV
jgi:hypothetical protein